jgi:hypothetical protein
LDEFQGLESIPSGDPSSHVVHRVPAVSVMAKPRAGASRLVANLRAMPLVQRRAAGHDFHSE